MDIAMRNPVYIGMAVTAHNNNALCTATIDQVNLVLPQNTPPAITGQPQNQTVADGDIAAFSVTADGSKPLFYQWRFNNANLSGATHVSFQRDPAQPSHAGAYRVVITNSLGSITSSVATLTVTANSTPPTFSSVANVGVTNVIVVFSEPVEASSSTNKNHYALNNSAAVQAAAYGTNSKTIILTTSTLVNNATYTLTVNQVRDRSSGGNTIATNSQRSFLVHIEQIHGILREVYLGTDGSLASLTNNSTFPDNPATTDILTNYFETPSNYRDQYGQRVRGYIIPPATGNYIFWISSDDQGALFLSSNDQPANKVQIANVTGWTPARDWSREPNQQSPPIALEASRVYYIEALMSEGGGGDNLAVKWQLPDGSQEEPIPAS